MKIEYGDGSTLMVDFVVPTVEEAGALIADGALNGCELLEEAGLSPAEAEAEFARLRPSKADQRLVEALYPPEGPFGKRSTD